MGIKLPPRPKPRAADKELNSVDNIREIKEWILEYNPDALLADGFDDAVIGVGNQHGSNPVVIYDSDKCIEILAEQFVQEECCEDPYLEAADYFGYNTACAYVGEIRPFLCEE